MVGKRFKQQETYQDTILTQQQQLKRIREGKQINLNQGTHIDENSLPYLDELLLTLQLKKIGQSIYVKGSRSMDALSLLSPVLLEKPLQTSIKKGKDKVEHHDKVQECFKRDLSSSEKVMKNVQQQDKEGLIDKQQQEQKLGQKLQQQNQNLYQNENNQVKSGDKHAPLGPALPSYEQLQQMYQNQVKEEEAEKFKWQQERRKIPKGPSIPTQDQFLEAQQILKEQQYQDYIGPDFSLDDIKDMDEVHQDKRQIAVARILDIVQEFQGLFQQHQESIQKNESNKAKPEQFLNPYQILKVDKKATGGEIKRAFQNISLLIHPDKCHHPQATEAFQIVRSAYDRLLDSQIRYQIDTQIEDINLWQYAEQEAKRQSRQDEWQYARTGSKPKSMLEAEVLNQIPQKQQREEWMTNLPDGMNTKMFGMMEQKNVNKLGEGMSGQQDKTWTETPQQALEGGSNIANNNTSNLSKKGIYYDPTVDLQKNDNKANDDNIQQVRKKSLLEQNLEKLRRQKEQEKVDQQLQGSTEESRKERKRQKKESKKDKKSKKKHKKNDESDKSDIIIDDVDFENHMHNKYKKKDENGWIGKHPWKPWDRETDLQQFKPKMGLGDVVKNIGSLGDKFQKGG